VFLTADELVDLTHRVKPAWQARALDQMHIKYRHRPDGTLVVLWDDVRLTQDAPRREPRLRAG